MPFSENFAHFLNPAEFAQAATLGGVAVTGIFDRAYEQANVGMAGMASTSPVFTLPTASVPANPVGTALVTGGVNYFVVEHQPDGTGISLLLMEKA